MFLCRECQKVSRRPLREGVAQINTLCGIFQLILTSKALIHLDVSEYLCMQTIDISSYLLQAIKTACM